MVVVLPSAVAIAVVAVVASASATAVITTTVAITIGVSEVSSNVSAIELKMSIAPLHIHTAIAGVNPDVTIATVDLKTISTDVNLGRHWTNPVIRNSCTYVPRTDLEGTDTPLWPKSEIIEIREEHIDCTESLDETSEEPIVGLKVIAKTTE
jgi:hypothetical protein